MGLLSCLKACFTSKRQDDNISNASSITNGSIRGQARNGASVEEAKQKELQRAYQEQKIAQQLAELKDPITDYVITEAIPVATTKTEVTPVDMGWIVVEQVNSESPKSSHSSGGSTTIEAPDTATFQLVDSNNKPICSPYARRVNANGSALTNKSKASIGSACTVPEPGSDYRFAGVETKFDPNAAPTLALDTYTA